MRFFVLQLIISASIVGNSCGQKPAECGVQKIKTKDLINRGYDTYPGQFPWHVGIFLLNPVTRYFEYACGGSLISSTFVLTARHCTTDEHNVEFNKKRLIVYMGIHNRTRFDQHSQKRSVKTIHSVSRVGRWERLRNDIALLELDSSVRFTDYVQPICLNSLDTAKLESGVVVGWGKTEGGVFSETLKAAGMPIRSHMECFASNPEVFGSTLDYGTICAGYQNGTSISNGDSGGGLVVKRCFVSKCSWSLAGIVSFAAGNVIGTVRSDGYGVFTEVQMYLPWIEQITNMTFKDDVSDGFCGQRQNESLRTRWPWHGTLYRVDSRPLIEGKPVKEGFGVTIVSDQFVITAVLVYRIVVLAPEDYRLRFGKPAGRDTDQYTQSMSIEATYIESVNLNNTEVYQDLALFKMKGRLTFTKYVQPICLWNEQDLKPYNLVLKYLAFFVQPETKINITLPTEDLNYFLSFDRSTRSNNPEEISMQILSMAFCEKERIVGIQFDDLFLCGQSREMNENGPQFWDIGTGFVVQKDDKWFIRGIYTNGYNGQFKPSLKNYHTMFLNVQYYYNSVIYKIDFFSIKYDD